MREEGRGKRQGGIARRVLVALLLALPASLFPLPSRAQTHLVIVSGLGGEKKYTDSFAKISAALADAASKRFHIPDSEIFWLGEDSASTRPHFRGQSTKINVERVLGQLATRVGPGDQIVLVLVGHGSGDGEDTKISIPARSERARFFVAVGALSNAENRVRQPYQREWHAPSVLSAPNRVITWRPRARSSETNHVIIFRDALTKDGRHRQGWPHFAPRSISIRVRKQTRVSRRIRASNRARSARGWYQDRRPIPTDARAKAARAALLPRRRVRDAHGRQ